MSEYDPQDDSVKSYYAAIEAKRLRGDAAITRAEVIGGHVLLLGDCREILPIVGRVHAVVTDPPYGIGESSKKAATRINLAAARDYGGNEDWDKEPADPRVIHLMRQNSDWQIIFGGNYFELPPTKCWLIWDKLNTGDFADCELAWTNLDKAVRRIQWLWNGMIRKGGEERFHLTQKPLGVMEWCLDHLPAGVKSVCDPYAGSGTTGVACVKRGLQFIGIEKQPPHFETMVRRIAEAVAKPDMFIESQRSPAPKQEALL